MSKPWRAFWIVRFHVCVAISLVLALGCKRDLEVAAPEGPLPAVVPLRVLVVDDDDLAEVIQREWNSRPGGKCTLTTRTSEQFLASQADRLAADVVVYPSGLLGELAERELIVPLEDDDLDDVGVDRQGILEQTRLCEVVWGERVYAVPFGSPQFTLFYRKDILARLNMAPPTTWPEYKALVERLAAPDIREFAAMGEESWSATAEPLAEGWAAKWFLARAAASARHRNQYSTLFDYRTMQPLIDGPPFVRTLEELIALAPYMPSDSLTPFQTRQLFLGGQCGMAISWPNRVEDASPTEVSQTEDWIGVAELPGSSDVYNFRTATWEKAEDDGRHVSTLAVSGRLGSVTSESRQAQQALRMLLLLTGVELGSEISSASPHTTFFRASQADRVALWADRSFDGESLRQYADVVQAAQSRSAWLACIRIPGRHEYLAALDEAVRSAVAGASTAAEALRIAAQRWEQITDAHDRQQQRGAYMRSLGLEP